MTDCFIDEDSSYLWLLKPNGLNRGRGIKIFNKIEQLENLLNEYWLDGEKNEKNNFNNKEINKKMERLVKSYQNNNYQKNTKNPKKMVVIQKYIEKPLLLNQRKFDIRVWSLITQNMDFYFFRLKNLKKNDF